MLSKGGNPLMLKLEHFYHLPQLDPLVERLVNEESGLVVVAGLDPRSRAVSGRREPFVHSGRSAIFRILMREILAANEQAKAIVVTEDASVVRIPRQASRRVRLWLVQPPAASYAARIADAVRQGPELLVIDKLCAENLESALGAAQGGLHVLSQLDTVFRGSDVARDLLVLGAPEERLGGLAWIVAVERLPMLCPRCRRPVTLSPAQVQALQRRYPDLRVGQDLTAFQSPGCTHCRHTGRRGDVAAFDLFHVEPGAQDVLSLPSVFPLEEYALGLASLGYVTVDDVLHLGADRLRRAYRLLTASERALADANAAMERKIAELEAAYRVLQQRTEALISLQHIGQVLISSVDLNDLADRVCRDACDLCGAEHAILYVSRTEEQADVLAVRGWDPDLIHQQLGADQVFRPGDRPAPARWDLPPPGVDPRDANIRGEAPRAGLRVLLVAQGERVGLMVVHSGAKSGFTPGETALLQTFANQAALAMQRAGLIDQLRAKIAELEAAQAELVQKERMERELELARQVQQSVLPRVFPQVPGYPFAACNEPARQVGGDFYDVIRLDADRFGVVIADVSDKGMPAALYMALTRSLLLAEAHRERSPCGVLASVNRLLLELGEPNMFVTVFYGIVDQATRRLTYARAGHDRPLLLREEALWTLGGRGACLGFLEHDDLHLSEEEMVLASGDKLVLYTDGLTDVLTPDGQLYSLEQFRSLLLSPAHLHPKELCAAVFVDLAAYRGCAEQYDDMTMLVLGVG